MHKVTRQFVKKGNRILVKEDVPDVELTSKDIMTNIDGLRNALGQMQQQELQLKNQIAQIDAQFTDYTKRLEEVSKFEEWAVEMQKSILKAKVGEVAPQIKEKIESTYDYDAELTVDQNAIQMYHQYVRFISEHENISKDVASIIIKQYLYKNKDILPNPWKDLSEEDLKKVLKK